jgi:hypothetical protein
MWLCSREREFGYCPTLILFWFCDVLISYNQSKQACYNTLAMWFCTTGGDSAAQGWDWSDNGFRQSTLKLAILSSTCYFKEVIYLAVKSVVLCSHLASFLAW